VAGLDWIGLAWLGWLLGLVSKLDTRPAWLHAVCAGVCGQHKSVSALKAALAAAW